MWQGRLGLATRARAPLPQRVATEKAPTGGSRSCATAWGAAILAAREGRAPARPPPAPVPATNGKAIALPSARRFSQTFLSPRPWPARLWKRLASCSAIHQLGCAHGARTAKLLCTSLRPNQCEAIRGSGRNLLRPHGGASRPRRAAAHPTVARRDATPHQAAHPEGSPPPHQLTN